MAASAFPLAAGQGHDHAGATGPIVLTHDGPADGRQFVGNLAHFAALARGDDAIPDFHQDLPLRVSLDGVVLFETTANSGHDYDGINVVDIVFPHTGTYLVEALGSNGTAVASFGGEVLPAPSLEVSLGLAQNPSDLVLAGQAVRFSHEVLANGTRVNHTDCLWEVVKGGATWFRTRTHTHDEAQELSYVFPEQGTYTLRTTCFQAFPSAKATLFLPIVAEHQVGVLPGPPAQPGLVPTVPAVPPAALNAVVASAAGELQLVGTFDPQTVVGTNTLQHLTVAALDPATGVPRQHVDFTARLDGPAGLVFQSDTLHEYDGLFELATRQSIPGTYTLTVGADTGSWSDSVQMAYTVVAPVVPTSAGPVEYTLGGEALPSGADAPQAATYVLSAQAAGGPFAHSEVELRVLHETSAVPLLMAKLHTHDDGTFPFTAALYGRGAVNVEVDGFPLMPEAVVVQPARFTVLVPHAQDSDSDVPQPAQDAPAALVPVLAGLLVAALLVGRRPRA